MFVPLRDAVASTCGGKAGALGALCRAGFDVPDGFVIPFESQRDAVGTLRGALTRALADLGDPPVAVRSSAAGEDTTEVSAAGQHLSVLGVRGADEVADAVRVCRDSLDAPRAVAYRVAVGHDGTPDEPTMAVLVQRLVDAEASGVMFTSDGASGATVIEASWGLGPSVVEGRVTPDSYRVDVDGVVTRRVAHKRTRLDRHGTALVTRDVPPAHRGRAVLDDAMATRLSRLGQHVADVLGGALDIEWALSEGRAWVLQARPVTAAVPSREGARVPPSAPDTLVGTPGSRGTATGPARIVRGAADFAHVCPGDIVVCPYTDPSWTPLLRIVAGVVTEVGGALSHAAIVAREQGIPAVLGVRDAMTLLDDGATVTLSGTDGTVTRSPERGDP